MTIQDNVPALNVLTDSIKTMQEQPELDMIKNVASTLQATSEYRQELKSKLQARVKELNMRKEQLTLGLEETERLSRDVAYTEHQHRYHTQSQDLRSKTAQLKQEIEEMDAIIDELVQQARLLGDEESKPFLDRNALKLKIFRQLGFDVVLKNSASSVVEAVRVKSSGGDDVETVPVPNQTQMSAKDKFELSNRLWDLCS